MFQEVVLFFSLMGIYFALFGCPFPTLLCNQYGNGQEVTCSKNALPKRKGIIIMVSGYKGSGKDTLVNYLVEKYGFERFAFADRLKDDACEEYEIPRQHADDINEKERPIDDLPVLSRDSFALNAQTLIYTHFRTLDGGEPTKDDRQFLLRIGENLCWKGKKLYWTPRALCVWEGSVKRSINPDHWVEYIEEFSDVERIAISDWRFENEYNSVVRIMENYIVVPIRVDCDTPSTAIDDSERGLDHFTGFRTRIFNLKESFEVYHKQIEKNLVRPILSTLLVQPILPPLLVDASTTNESSDL